MTAWPHVDLLTRRISMTAVVVLALLAAHRSAVADDSCRPIVPEATDDVARAGLPTESARWRAVERLWSEAARSVEDDASQALSSGSLGDAADLIQGRTNDALREAIKQRQDTLAHSMLGLWLKPLDKLSRRDRVLAYYLTPTQRLSEARLDHAQEMWVGPDGVETILYSAIYLAGATDIALAVALRPPAERSEALAIYSRRISKLALSHYKRWAFGPPYVWQVRGWGCDASGFDLVEFTRRRANRSLGNGSSAYCVAPTDLDMLLMIGISNLLRLSDIAPDLITVPLQDRERLASLLRLQADYMASRLVWTTMTDDDGRLVSAVDFDPGAWTSHPDWSHAAEETPRFPTAHSHVKLGIGRDLAHGYRIAWMALTLAEHPDVVAETADWGAVADALAHQLAYRVLDTTAEVPRFRNYLDGSNGWYRVNVDGRDGFGFPPYGLSRTYLETAWARLANRDPKLLAATAKMWKILADPSRAECDDFNRFYVEGNFWKDRKPFPRAFSGPTGNMSILPFVAVSPVQ